MKTPLLFRGLPALLAASALLSPRFAGAQQDFSEVQIQPHHVAGTVYYLEGRGGNIGLSVGEDGVVMIDDQFAPLTDRILAAIRKINDGDIRFVINTHVHGDHTGGNENLGRMGIVILARDEVRVRHIASAPEAALPVLTYSDAITIHLNGEEVHPSLSRLHIPDGDSYIYFRGSDVLHAGDVFRTTGFPFIDLNNGGTLQGTLDALALAIPRHDPRRGLEGQADGGARHDVRAGCRRRSDRAVQR